MTDQQKHFFFNGLNGSTGDYGLSLDFGELARAIAGAKGPQLDIPLDKDGQPTRATAEGVDGTNLAQAGWGIIFPADDPQTAALKEALGPLLALRREQAGPHFRLFEGADGYRPGESKVDFLARHRVGAGPVDPARGVPYYLLLAGCPAQIPFHFQYQLDVQFAVGRLCFERLADYEHYARSVVAAEQNQVSRPRRLTFFGATNPDDRATDLSTRHLIQPLYTNLKANQGVAESNLPAWEVNLVQGEAATHARLEALLGGEETPALLFTAGHGMEFLADDTRQVAHQGALLCQDWPGPVDWRGPIPEAFYFAGDHVGQAAHVGGLISFHFACYGAGTPTNDDFRQQPFQQQRTIAAQPFVARLPQALLSHPNGGALAVVGHVERAWGYSFFWPGAGEQTAVFESALLRLLKGAPVGWALEYFNQRYGELAADLTSYLERHAPEAATAPAELVGLWTANNDARNYVIIGDPAARLPLPPDAPAKKVADTPGTILLPKPIPDLSDYDWAQTPAAVQAAMRGLVQRANRLQAQLTAMRRPDEPTMYALLVGIDAYANDSIPRLGGCANDVRALAQCLRDRFNVPAENIQLLINEQATHQAIKDAFRTHLIDQAKMWADLPLEGPPPAFLFHFSGHGSRARDGSGQKASGFDETIVPHNSRTTNVYDIKDWELGQLIDEINQHTDNVTIILDCCHSGSGTRDVKPSLLPARRCEPDLRPQPRQRPPGSIAQAQTRGLGNPSGWSLGDKHVLLAGCRAHEEAYEYLVSAGDSYRQYGAMTYFLLQALDQMRPTHRLTYRELYEQVRHQVNAHYRLQMPQCEGDRERQVFAGLRPARDLFLTVVEIGDDLVWINGGAAHNLTPGSQLKVYSPQTRTLAGAGQPLATLSVVSVGTVRSGCRVDEGQRDLPLHARAAIHRLYPGDMVRRVVLDIARETLSKTIRQRLSRPDVATYIELVPPDRPADFRLQAVDDLVELQDGAGQRLVAPFPPDKVQQIGSDLAHLVRFHNALELQNADPGSILAGALSVAIKRLEIDPGTNEPYALPVAPSADGDLIVTAQQKIVIEVTNHSDQDLYIAIFDFSYDWSIRQLFPRLRGARERLAGGKTISLGLSNERRSQLAPSLARELNEAREFIKVIATVQEADFEILQQRKLKEPFATRGVTPGLKPASALDRLMAQAMQGGRTRSPGPPPDNTSEAWTTAQIGFRLVQANN